MSLNPKEEALYRLELAGGYLDRARKAFALGDFADTMAEAQLSVENSAMAGLFRRGCTKRAGPCGGRIPSSQQIR